MSYKMILAAAALAAGTSPAFAQGFTGASVGIDYQNFSDFSGFSRTTFYVAGEMAFTSNISASADFASYAYESGDYDASNYLLHGIYYVNQGTALGLFIGSDSLLGAPLTIIGAEGKVDFGAGSAEVYSGIAYDDFDEFDLFGISGEYEFLPNISAIANLDLLTFETGDTLSQFDIGGQYELPTGGKLYATLGSLGVSNSSATDPTYSIGATFDFGPKGGTTFGRRSFFETFPL